jgi:glycosyltransferase involved in cell wall biosynthesis
MMTESDQQQVTGSPGIACSAIDIGLITYNERAMLEPTLSALLEAGFDSFIVLDMQSNDGTVDYIYERLGEMVKIVNFPRRSLMEYGFAEARNICAVMSKREWLLFVDADEVLLGGVENGFVTIKNHGQTPDVYGVSRNNLQSDPDGGGNGIKVHSVETFNRLYKPTLRMRYAGYIHEDIHHSGMPCCNTGGQTNLVFDHHSLLKTSVDLVQKEGLYALMLLRIYNQPDLRGHTYPWWYESYVPDHLAILTERATEFARQHGVPASFYGPIPQGAASYNGRKSLETWPRSWGSTAIRKAKRLLSGLF